MEVTWEVILWRVCSSGVLVICLLMLLFSPKILEELGNSNSCIFCTLAWKNGFTECVEFNLKINQSISQSLSWGPFAET